jgi:hypothetical protein
VLAADRYATLVTVLAILVAVIYAEGVYDTWDAFLGIVGFALGVKYIPDANREGALFIFLVASLLSASLVAVLFSLFTRHLPFSDFTTFLIGLAIGVAVIRLLPTKAVRWISRRL